MRKIKDILKGIGIAEGHKVVTPIDKERYPSRPGLEGPFRAKNGKVAYYDPKEGKYYDSDKDMFIPNDDWQAMNEGEDAIDGMEILKENDDEKISYEQLPDNIKRCVKRDDIIRIMKGRYSRYIVIRTRSGVADATKLQNWMYPAEFSRISCSNDRLSIHYFMDETATIKSLENPNKLDKSDLSDRVDRLHPKDKGYR